MKIFFVRLFIQREFNIDWKSIKIEINCFLGLATPGAFVPGLAKVSGKKILLLNLPRGLVFII